MLGLVKTALLKPYTFIVLAIFICIIGPLAACVRPPMCSPISAFRWWRWSGSTPVCRRTPWPGG